MNVEKTTDPVGPSPPEFPALLRRREAIALKLRLEKEYQAEREGGPKASKW